MQGGIHRLGMWIVADCYGVCSYTQLSFTSCPASSTNLRAPPATTHRLVVDPGQPDRAALVPSGPRRSLISASLRSRRRPPRRPELCAQNAAAATARPAPAPARRPTCVPKPLPFPPRSTTPESRFRVVGDALLIALIRGANTPPIGRSRPRAADVVGLTPGSKSHPCRRGTPQQFSLPGSPACPSTRTSTANAPARHCWPPRSTVSSSHLPPHWPSDTSRGEIADRFPATATFLSSF